MLTVVQQSEGCRGLSAPVCYMLLALHLRVRYCSSVAFDSLQQSLALSLSHSLRGVPVFPVYLRLIGKCVVDFLY